MTATAIEKVGNMSKTKKLPSIDIVEKRVSYNPDTGEFKRISFWCGNASGRDDAGRVNDNGYLEISIENERYKAHRLAWLLHHGSDPDGFIDHIDGDKLNNKASNLRLATKSQNMMNRPEQKNNKLGIKGVHFDKRNDKFVAQICRDGKRVFLGRFSTANEAKGAYESAAESLHLEFMNGGSYGI